MALIITGKRYYDFQDKNDKRIRGLKLHCLEQLGTPNEGQLTETISIGYDKPVYPLADGFVFGSVITPIYNKYGAVTDIILKELPGGLVPDGKPLPEVSGKLGK